MAKANRKEIRGGANPITIKTIKPFELTHYPNTKIGADSR
jgi:hypothetical protein